MIKIIFAMCLFLGRIDIKFLNNDVSNMHYMELDGYPDIHLSDLLAHEAHRHPYIEMLGSTYLMKLIHGKRYCTRAGSAWRLLLIYALMPWMKKYRVQTRPELLEVSKAWQLAVADGSNLPASSCSC